MATIDLFRDAEAAEPWFWWLIEDGDTRAMVCVGDHLKRVSRHDEAKQWYRKAAEAGDPAGMVRMAVWLDYQRFRYDQPRESEEREDQIRAWYRVAAQAGHTSAMISLASKVTDFEEERYWLQRAVEFGELRAAVKLGHVLAEKELPEEAEQWYRRGAQAGVGLRGLAELLSRQGRFDEAEQWYREDIETNGDYQTMSSFAGFLDERGRHQEAREMYRLAAMNRPMGPGPHSPVGALPTNIVIIVTTATITTTIVTFVTTLATKAAEDSYKGARDLLRRIFTKHREPSHRSTSAENNLLIVEDPDPKLNLALHLWTDTSDEAIRALAGLNLDEMSEKTKDENVNKVRIYWNQNTKSWKILRER